MKHTKQSLIDFVAMVIVIALAFLLGFAAAVPFYSWADLYN